MTIRINSICTTQLLSWRMTHKFLWDFDIQTNHLISVRRPDLIIIIKKKKKRKKKERENLQNCAHRIKLKECEKRISTSTLLGNWKDYGTCRWQLYQSWMVFLIQSPKDYWRTWGLGDLGVGGRVETIPTTVLLRRVLDGGDLLLLRLQWKTTSYNRCEKLSMSKYKY